MTMVLDGLYQRGGQPVGPIGVGNIYYVYDTKSTDSASYIDKRFLGQTYDDDNSELLYPHTATSAPVVTTDGFTNALAATKAGRNDYVVVLPTDHIYKDYYLNALLTMSKAGVHLVCPAGMGPEVGSANAALLWQKDDYDIINVTASRVEIAGLSFVNYDKQSSITLASSFGRNMNIHHNNFLLYWISGAQVGAIVATGSGGAWGCIDKNFIVSFGVAAVSCAGGIIEIYGSGTGCRVCYNHISLNTGTAAYGIFNNAIAGITAHNIISEAGGGGTITKAISIYPTGCAVGNLLAVGAGQDLDGGTGNNSYVENYEASNGGLLAT